MWTGNDVIACGATYGHRREIKVAYSESPYMISYLTFIVIFCLTLTVSKIFAFEIGPKMTSLPLAALCVAILDSKWRILKERPRFPIGR